MSIVVVRERTVETYQRYSEKKRDKSQECEMGIASVEPPFLQHYLGGISHEDYCVSVVRRERVTGTDRLRDQLRGRCRQAQRASWGEEQP